MLAASLGWFATAVLLATLARQVYAQWRSGSTEGVSRWLFVGQMTASAAFLGYALLVGNLVFVVANALLVLTAAAGQLIYRHNRRREARRAGAATAAGRRAPAARGEAPRHA